MKYDSISKGVFLNRPNRFIANVRLEGKETVCHVKNTGRCRELLVPGADVILSKSASPHRKTAYDLISVYKGSRLINMDSQAPNSIAGEYLPRLFPDLYEIRREVTCGNSRLDYCGMKKDGLFYLEVKGVTLEKDNIAFFPDAPTERGVKHLHELAHLKANGIDAHILFVIQMQNVLYFCANRDTDPDFADALLSAKKAGVGIHAVDCLVTPDSVTASNPIPVRFV